MKLIVDILMFILMLLQLLRGYIPTVVHEIVGILLFVLVVIHLILNRNFIKNIFKGKYNLNRLLMTIISVGFFITFFLSMILGILSSQDILISLNIGNYDTNHFHKVVSFISIIILSLHLGINYNAMFGKVTNKFNKNLFNAIQLIIIGCGIYSFIDLKLIKRITGTYGFSKIDGNPYIIFIEYLCVVMMITFIMYNIAKIINKKDT